MRKPLVAALLCLPLLAVAAPAAQAAESRPEAAPVSALQVPVRTVNWDLTSTNANTLRARYSDFIRSLRNTGTMVGGSGSDAVWETSRGNEVIAVNVTYGWSENGQGVRRTVTLYLTANNLYLRGFSTGNAGNVVQFSQVGEQEPFDLGHALGRNAIVLPYSGRYGGNHSLEHGDTRSRQLWLTPNGVWGNMNTLWTFARDGGDANTLRDDLVAAIALTSESARFRNIEGTVRQALGGGTSLTAQEAAEENDWGRGSRWIYQERNGSRPTPTDIGGATVTSYAEATHYIAMLRSDQR
ncbi:ribosome inactivating protein [Streptomyces sp. CG 926]|uniref:ribosome-inactivating family protein n=1 Tax=Streptomyces sp. CG 926 TaxID=1882405 RepID=UPI000D79CA7D|nr:ribosome-inactivating family protein [Streptomyces sp. CG 926]PWK74700.1 ribosome inactivating protein [Streptomyces sp. CG 926]